MAKEVVFLLLTVLVAKFCSCTNQTEPPPYGPWSAKIARMPPYLRPGFVEEPSAAFNSTKASGRSSNVYPNWTPLHCDGSVGSDPSLKSPNRQDVLKPTIIVLNNGLISLDQNVLGFPGAPQHDC